MADTTPQVHTFDNLLKEIEELEAEIAVKQKALVQIYRIFDSSMHPCKLDFTFEGRMRWMQNIAKVASAKTVGVKQVIDDTMESANVEVLKTKKPAKVVGVGVAGEKSGH